MGTVSESAVLKPLEASKKRDENSWPEFLLHDVVIRRKSNSEILNLLHAHTGDLATVHGVLHEKEAADPHRHKRRGFGKVRVVIDDVKVYSYGLDDDGSLSFWAAGQAGWFKLHSVSKEYQATYASMEVGASLLYYLCDRIARQRRDYTKNTNEKELNDHIHVVMRGFQKSEQNRSGLSTSAECYEAFRIHRFFLIKCMLENAENVEWRNKPFMHWYKRVYPEDVQFIAGVVDQTAVGPIPETSDASSQGDEASNSGEDMELGEGSSRVTRKPLVTTPPPTRPLGRTMRRTRGQAAAETDGAESTDDDGRVRSRNRIKRKRKSVLRPFGSAKTPRKTNKINPRRDGLRVYRNPTMEEIGNDQMEQDDEDITDSEDERVVQKALDRQLHLQLHQRLPQISSDDNDNNDDDDDESDESDDEGGGEELDQVNGAVDGNRQPQRHRHAQPAREYYEPRQGTADTWTCPYDGCNHKVWDSRSTLGRQLIQQHYGQQHLDSMEALVRSEARPWAHVGNLLARINALNGGGPGASRRSRSGSSSNGNNNANADANANGTGDGDGNGDDGGNLNGSSGGEQPSVHHHHHPQRPHPHPQPVRRRY